MIHRPVLFIADSPSPRNVSSRTPLVGTQSYATFLSWLAKMNVDSRLVNFYNRVDSDAPGAAVSYDSEGWAIVALGEAASQFLYSLKVRHHKLPHPSGLNRALNDKKALAQSLSSVSQYIYSSDAPAAAFKRRG